MCSDAEASGNATANASGGLRRGCSIMMMPGLIVPPLLLLLLHPFDMAIPCCAATPGWECGLGAVGEADQVAVGILAHELC